MRKRVFGKKLSRGSGSRRALKRSLIAALVEHGSIKTTKTKAKFVTSDIDKLVSLAKKDNLVAKRRVYAAVGNKRKTAERVFLIAKAFSDRNSGYTKTTLLEIRKGDNTEMVRLEWAKDVGQTLEEKTKGAKVKRTKATKSAKQTVENKKGIRARLSTRKKKETAKNK